MGAVKSLEQWCTHCQMPPTTLEARCLLRLPGTPRLRLQIGLCQNVKLKLRGGELQMQCGGFAAKHFREIKMEFGDKLETTRHYPNYSQDEGVWTFRVLEDFRFEVFHFLYISTNAKQWT